MSAWGLLARIMLSKKVSVVLAVAEVFLALPVAVLSTADVGCK